MAMSRGTTSDNIVHDGTKLDLRDRNLSTEDVSMLARLISSTSRLEILSLYNVKLSSEDAVSLARALEFNDTLITLNFTHNPIGEVGTAALAEVIKFNTTLREVSLANTVLNPQGCALLADALMMNRGLTHLNLEKNRIGEVGARYLAGALRASESLSFLSLDGNHIGDAGVVAISSALDPEGGATLASLSLANTGVTEDGARLLGDALANNTYLDRLVMAKLELQPQLLRGEGQEATSRGLQTIDFSKQSLSATLDYPVICRLMDANPRLARLQLTGAGLCGVTSAGRGRRSIAGLQSLASMLQASPPRLVVLDLSRNFVDDTAAEVIATGLDKNRILRTLILHGNGIGKKGIKALVACLPTSIVELDISNNPSVGESGGAAVGRFLADYTRSANLRRLDVSTCNLGNEGLTHIAEGLEVAKKLEQLSFAGNLNDHVPSDTAGVSGDGKLAIGMALMTGDEARLQGLAVDLWTMSKGQREFRLVRPRGTVPCQLPTTADVCLLAGVVCSHDWLRVLVLDGNPIEETGLAYLSRALLRNSKIQSLSLRRCGLGERSGMLLLRLLGEKPGLEVDASEGNYFGEDIGKKLDAALELARGFLIPSADVRRPMVHLLGNAGAGKTTLRETMGRGYFSALFNTGAENAKDTGAEDASQRTLGVTTSTLSLGNGGSTILVRDHGGLRRFRGLGALDSGITCPTSLYVMVVNLMTEKQEQKRQIKYWLRLVQAIGPAAGSVILLVGSRADQLGSVGQDYLQKLWERAREDLTREELRAGLDASLPTFAGCFAVDCRRAGDANVGRLKEAIARADKLFHEDGEGWTVPPLQVAAAARVERWAQEGSIVVRWLDFVTAVQRQLCPRATEADCVDLAKSLAREGRIVCKGLSAKGERQRGKGWLVLRPSFFLHDVVGGIYGASELTGPISAAAACQSVLGGPDTVDPSTLVQALIDGDVCAELLDPEERGADANTRAPGHDDAALGGRSDALSEEAETSPPSQSRSLSHSPNSTLTKSHPTATGSIARRGRDGLGLGKRRLMFPAVMLLRGNGGPERTAFGCGSDALFCGRRVACRMPILLPGLFDMLQARLANRYPRRVHLQKDLVRLSLVGGETSVGGLIEGGQPLESSAQAGEGTPPSAPLVATVEFVESELPGRDAVDIIVASEDRKACFLTVISLRLQLEQILSQAPAVVVEDMAIAQGSLRDGLAAKDRLTLQLSQLHETKSKGETECSFGGNTPLEALSDILWDGPEELEVDTAGRIVSTHRPSKRPSLSSTPSAGTVRKAPPDAAGGSANPFAPGFSQQDTSRGSSPTDVANRNANVATTSAANPFAASPAPARDALTPVLARAPPASTAATNPFASPPPLESAPPRTRSPPKAPSSKDDRSAADEGSRERDHDSQEMLDCERSGPSESDSDRSESGSDNDSDNDSVGDSGETSDKYTSDEDEGADDSRPPSFTFDGRIFRDPGRLFAGHLSGTSYHLGKQRAEVVLRSPGALKLGIWRAPADEREEREREKDRGKAATEASGFSHDRCHNHPHGGRRSPGSSGPVKRNAAVVAHVVREEAASGGSDGDGGSGSDTEAPTVDDGYLSTERPAVLEEVLREDVIAGFDWWASGDAFGLVGCVVASVSHEPFESSEAPSKLPTYLKVIRRLEMGEYPLFIQLCRPPLLFSAEPEYPSVKLRSTLTFCNRNVVRVDGEFRFGNALEADGVSRWMLTTTAVPSDVGELGTGMQVSLAEHHVVGMYLLTQEEALSLVTDFPSRDVLVYVHGFNTPFGFGVRSMAMKGRALRKSLGVCLAWPSDPPGEGAGWLIKQVMSTYERRYTYCEHNMHATIFLFLEASLALKAAAGRGGKAMCWKGHSMGCYLLLNMVDRLRWKGEDLHALFGRVILDAPDVPTWFFSAMVKVLADYGVSVCHYFNPGDNAIYASCSRRALQRPVPGQDAIVAHPLVQGILCDKARSSSGMNHDYGRTDGRCLLDQRDFMAGEAPEQRVLDEKVLGGIACWQLKT